ncbi:MAG: Ltp family lipoprotein [Acidimicrobiales bacterium]|nr:Ltp family lipoprotein [Acidimicrobiales bacterium]
MKRSVVVLVALGLLAGLVGCGGSADPLSDSLSEAEAEARQWLVDITTENAKSIFEEVDITSVSAEEFATCYLGDLTENSPRFGDSDYWQQEKALKIDSTNFYLWGEDPWAEGDERSENEHGAFNSCRFRLILNASEDDRLFDFYVDSIFPDLTSENDPVQQPATTSEPTGTVSQQQAAQSAQDYLNYSSFSRSGLIDQLEYEGFSTADATYGVDAQNADWNAQAAQSAQDYLNYSSFSRSGLIDQLMFEGFTREQAIYGVNAVGL